MNQRYGPYRVRIVTSVDFQAGRDFLGLYSCRSINEQSGVTIAPLWLRLELKVIMLLTASQLPLYVLTAVVTHLVVSFAQTLLHYKLGHHPRGGKMFSNHINFHHTHYAKDRLVSKVYLDDEGNNTPFFLIPVFLGGGVYIFPLTD